MKELDLTKGSVPRVLLKFAMPYLLANVLQALYGGADLFVVGQFDDAASVAGVAIGSQVMQTATGIILGLTAGITILIGISKGAHDDKELAAVIGSSVWLFAIVGIVLTVAATLLHTPIAVAMNTPPEAMADTRHYLLICSLGIPFIIGYNVVCGILRGLGDSQTPLYFVALACVINVAADFVLVGACGLRAAGAAIATVAAQGISFGAALWFMRRRGFSFAFTRHDIRLNGALSRRVLKLGAPIALQDALINVSFLLITVIVNRMGVVPSAALGVVEKIIVFAMLPMAKCLRSGIGMALAFGLAVCLYSQFLPETLTGIFTADEAVVAMGATYLRGYSIDCVMVSFVFCFNSYFSGQGNSWFPMVHSMIATFLFRIPLSWAFSHVDDGSLTWMGFAPPLSTLVSLLICVWYIRRSRRKRACA